MLIREFLQVRDPILRQSKASSRTAGWVLVPDVNEDARARSVCRVGRVINDQPTAIERYRTHVFRANRLDNSLALCYRIVSWRRRVLDTDSIGLELQIARKPRSGKTEGPTDCINAR